MKAQHRTQIAKKFRRDISKARKLRPGRDDGAALYEDALLAIALDCDDAFDWAESYELWEIRDEVDDLVDELSVGGLNF